MCERYSWIEKDGEVIFLTADDVFKTKRGKALQKHTCQDDWYGHGAVRWYYHFTDGIDRECTDFSTPKNFPAELVEAIKDGKMWGFGITEKMKAMLLAPAWAEYKKIQQSAWAEYEKIQKSAFSWAKFMKLQPSAWAKYQKTAQKNFAGLFKNPNNRKKCWR